MNFLREYLKSKKENPIGEYSLGNSTVYIKEPLVPEIDLQNILKFVSENLPIDFYSNVEMIYIGNFPFLIARQVDALFENGAIYLSSKIKTEQHLLADLIHEIAHAFEEANPEEVYSDGAVEQEFLSKRNKMLEIFRANGYTCNTADFLNTEYDKSFDEMLYSTLGYEKVGNMTSGLFISPYAATSLREYFANAFEEFFVRDMKTVQKSTPAVYKKIVERLDFF